MTNATLYKTSYDGNAWSKVESVDLEIPSSQGFAMVTFKNDLYCIYISDAGKLAAHHTSNMTDWTTHFAQTVSPGKGTNISAAALSDRLVVVFPTKNNGSKLSWMSSKDGKEWGEEHDLDKLSIVRPDLATDNQYGPSTALAGFGDRIVCMSPGTDHDHNLFGAVFNGSTWANFDDFGKYPAGDGAWPALAATKDPSLLYCVRVGLNYNTPDTTRYDRTAWTTFNGSSWSDDSTQTPQRTGPTYTLPLSVAEYFGDLIAVLGYPAKWMKFDHASKKWSELQIIRESHPDNQLKGQPATLVNYQGILYCFAAVVSP